MASPSKVESKKLEHAEWKKTRDRIDSDRLRWQKDETGRWKREWDQNKPLDWKL